MILNDIFLNGESQNGCSKKTKHAKFFEKRTFITPDTHRYVCVSGGKKCLFFGKLGVLCFLETPILRFALLAYYQQFNLKNKLYEQLFNLTRQTHYYVHRTSHFFYLFSQPATPGFKGSTRSSDISTRTT